MKKYILYLFAIIISVFASCESFRDANEAKKIAPISISVKLNLSVENLATVKNLTIKFDNYPEDLHLVQAMSGQTLEIDGLIPGVYTVSVSGTAIDTHGNEYYINGNLVNKALYEEIKMLEITVQGLKVSPLIFKEIYYAGSKDPNNKNYFRDQFYEIYNNSSETLYLDGICFANLVPGKATTKLPVWPAEDGNNYAYGERVWRFPGKGSDYPLASGESCVISQFAANHKLPLYNPNSPVDCSSSDFEFNMDNPNFPDQPAKDMEHVFYNGKAEKGKTPPQYLTSVFGGAYVIFKVPSGETWDPVNNPAMRTINLNETNGRLYAKIPIKYVLDAVEAIDNESMVNAKRVPAVLDAGLTYVGATYCGLGVVRLRTMGENGEPIRRENGALIFQDTNNSTDDFERGIVPMLRRYDTKIPAWNHTK